MIQYQNFINQYINFQYIGKSKVYFGKFFSSNNDYRLINLIKFFIRK